MSGAPSTVFQYVCGLQPIPTASKSCPLEKISECWRCCKKYLDDLEDRSTEEKLVQAAFSQGVGIILSSLRYSHYSLLETTNVIGIGFKPDIIIAKQGVTKPGFQDVLAVVELMSPTVSLSLAVAQASKYLNEISGRGSCDFSHLMHSSLVAIASNYREICIFGLSKIDFTPVLGLYTNQNAFHPDGNLWTSPQLDSQTYAMQSIKRATAPPKSLRSTIVKSSLLVRS